MLLLLLLLLTVHVVAGEDEARGTAVDDARKALHQSVSWGLGFGVWGLGFGVWGLGFACTVGWENCSSSCASSRLEPNLSELTRT